MIEKVHIPLDQWLAMTPEQRAPFERAAGGFVIDLNFDDPWRQPIDNSAAVEREEMRMTEHEQDAWHNPRQTHRDGKL
jgi:hypothetical protein